MRAPILCLVLVFAACGGSPKAATCPAVGPATGAPVVEAAAPPAPAAEVAPEAPDDATVIAWSHALLEAFDRNDVASFEARIGPAFVMFEHGRSYEGARLAKGMAARAERKASQRTRAWSDERVIRSPDLVVFIGQAVESIPAEPDRPASTLTGWNTLVWTRAGADWKARHWQWQKGGVEGEKDMWNDMFRTSVGFNREPNKLLVETLAAGKPRKGARALDIAMGQGRNAIALAASGYQTTGVDISDEGLRQAQAAAAKRKLKMTTIEADVDVWDLGKDRWDLVALIYAGSDPKMLARIKAAVKPGGLVVVEFFHKEATAGTGIGGFETGALAAAFDGWEIVRDEVVDDIADWGLRKTKLVRFVARRR